MVATFKNEKSYKDMRDVQLMAGAEFHRACRKMLPLLACVAAVFVTTAIQADDKVYLVSGTSLTGEISDISRDEIVISVRGKPQNVPVNTIARVSFDREPSAFSRAKEFVAQGQWEQADEEFKSVDPKSLESDNLKKDYLFYRSLIAGQLALAGKGNANQPAAGLVQFAQANGKSHHFYTLCEVLGGLAASLGSYPDARKYYSGLEKAPFPEYKIKAAYLVGAVSLMEGKADEAKAEFEKVQAATASDPVSQRYQKLASVAIIKTDIAKGNAKSAIDQLLKLAETNDSSDIFLFANIYNALGEAHLAINELNNAKLSYLATDLLFSSDADKHAEALYNLAILWEKTGDPQRAVDARTRLKEQYAGSIWAKKP